MKKNILFIFLTFAVVLCGQKPSSGKPFQHPDLTLLWSTTEGLITPESVLYDKENNVLYVANINGNPTEHDGNGFISIVTMEGKFNKLHWVDGLNAPKGMGIYNHKLYVTDINAVAEIDIPTGKITNRYEAKEAKFLNDISIDKNGNVYISDMQTNKIYRLHDQKLSIWLDSPLLISPNGLWVEGNNLLIGTNGAVLKCNIESKKVDIYIKDTGSIDGLVSDGKGHYLISDWQGHVHLVSPDKKKVLLLDTTPDKINAADIEYIVKEKILLIPTFFDNRVMAYKLNR